MIPFPLNDNAYKIGSCGGYDFLLRRDALTSSVQLICVQADQTEPAPYKFRASMKAGYDEDSYQVRWDDFIIKLTLVMKDFEVGGMRDETDSEKVWRVIQELFETFKVDNERFNFDKTKVDHSTHQVPI